MTAFPFEDEFYDVLKKARFGLGWTLEATAAKARLTPEALRALEAGTVPATMEPVRQAAAALGLDPLKLVALVSPQPPRIPAVHVPFTRMILAAGGSAATPPQAGTGTGFTMNGYLLACPESRSGFIVDPGFDAPAIEAAVAALKMDPAAILVTHAHHDHVGALPETRARFPVPVYALANERGLLGEHASGMTLVRPGHEVTAGTLSGVFRHVPGHTDGMGVIIFPGAGLAFVGDALFARSLGRASAPGEPYRTLRRRVEEEILSLPGSTVLCPGHGPLTTVADELALNPFFP